MKKLTPWLLVTLLLVAAGAWYVTVRQPADSHPSEVSLPEVAPAVEEPQAEFPVEAIEPVAPPPAPPEPLPPLEQSDATVTEELAVLVGPESLDAYFVMEQLVNRFVTTIDSLTSREIAPLVLPLKPVSGTFLASREGDVLTISAENHARYAPYVNLVSSMDTARVVDLYTRYYPLIQEAYEALGYPGAYFNDRLVEVLDHLLETPEVAGPVRLLKPEAVYLYADGDLEALSAGQKVLLRMGPENAGVVRDKLEEIRAAVAGT